MNELVAEVDYFEKLEPADEEIYDVFFCSEATLDLLDAGLKKSCFVGLRRFLASEACRLGYRHNKIVDYELDIWSVRWPKPDRGSRSGLRVIYYRQEKNIFVYRIFDKHEVDCAKEKLHNNLAQTYSDLQEKLLLKQD